MTSELFQPLKRIHDPCPIVLIDKSGSTNSRMDPSGLLTTESIFDCMVRKIQGILLDRKIATCRVILWSGDTELFVVESVEDFVKTIQQSTLASDRTDLSCAFHALPPSWFKGRKFTHIYILTDGEITDDKYHLDEQIRTLYGDPTNQISIEIITFESNDKEYKEVEAEAGNELLQIIQQKRITHCIDSFRSYNCKYYDNPFVHLSKPVLQTGLVPFREHCFPVLKLNSFLVWVKQTIDSMTSSEELLALVHDLLPALDGILKLQARVLHPGLIQLFADLFSSSHTYSELQNALLDGFYKFQQGEALTFHQYRCARKTFFQDTQQILLNSVKPNLSPRYQSEYLTFPIPTEEGEYKIFRVRAKQVTTNLISGVYKYPQACVPIDGFLLPVLPWSINVPSETMQQHDQILRQWIRTVYSLLVNVSPSDDIILYLFLSHALTLTLCDTVPEKVKRWMTVLARIMLNKKSFHSDSNETEYECLLKGRPPVPSIESPSSMTRMLSDCATRSGFQGPSVHPYTWWYAIIDMFEDEQLRDNQLQHCREGLLFDRVHPSRVRKFLQSNLKVTYVEEDRREVEPPEYQCYVTLEDTSATGGLQIPPHPVGESSTICQPRYVISTEGLSGLLSQNGKAITCPLCHHLIDVKSLTQIPPQTSTSDEKIPSRKPKRKKSKFLLPRVFKENTPVTFSSLVDLSQLHPMDSFDWDTLPLVVSDATVLTSKSQTKTLVVRSLEAFQAVVREKFSFLLSLDMTNLVIMGGFCRSILLGQTVNDLDFYVIGLGAEEMQQRLERFLLDLFECLLKTDDNTAFLCVYRAESNVYEVFAYNQTTERISHKIQVFLVGFSDVSSLVRQSDMHPAAVVWDQRDVLFTRASASAYRGMVNVITKERLAKQDTYRFKKYWEYGFSLVVEREVVGVSVMSSTLDLSLATFTVVKAREHVLTVEPMWSTCKSAPKETLRYEGVSEDGKLEDKKKSEVYHLLKRIEKLSKDHKVIYYKHATRIGLSDVGSLSKNYENGAQIVLSFREAVSSLETEKVD